MRTYPQDSPQAAARIVAMAALADGHLCSSEVERLDGLGITSALRLPPGEWPTVLRHYCEDLLVNAPSGWTSLTKDAPMIGALLGEIQDPSLRRTILRVCAAIADADAHRAEGESIVMQAAAAQWGVTRADVERA